MKITPDLVQIGLATFVQIVGLLSAWRQERKGASGDEFQNFITWLQVHHFDQLKERIFESDELQRELHGLLAGGLAGIESKLNSLEAAIAGVAAKIDGLTQVGRASAASAKGLSPQACEILKLFADSSGDTEMAVADRGPEGVIITMLPSTAAYRMDEPKFVADDLQSLQDFEMIRLERHLTHGSPVFALTRAGWQLAGEMPSVVLKDPSA